MRMKFGVFMAPFHELGENPTTALERDLQLLELLDELGYDEAWIGEHHSVGWETIASPEVFIAVASQRTRRIKLGTGVVSLPYHHPLMVANRMVLLDHLTRGRVMLGVGPGALITDAFMLGIEPNRQREMMAEALDAIMELLTSEEPVTCQTDWFKLVNARIQLRPYTEPHMPIAVASVQSPAGVTLAGKHGLGVITIAHRVGVRGLVDISQQWRIAEDTAAEHGKQMRREEWRINMLVHLADSKQQALDDVRERGNRFVIDYQYNGTGSAEPDGGPLESIVDRMAASGAAVIGTPDDLIATIERYQEITGGFGCLLVQVNEWATWEKTRHSYELLARYVMPRFQGSLRNLEASYSQAASHVAQTRHARRAAIEHAHESYERRLDKLPS